MYAIDFPAQCILDTSTVLLHRVQLVGTTGSRQDRVLYTLISTVLVITYREAPSSILAGGSMSVKVLRINGMSKGQK